MNKVAHAFAVALKFADKWIQTIWDFLSDTSVFPKRYMELKEPDGTEVRAIIISQEGDAYTIEIPRSEYHWYTFWRYQAETKVVFASDFSILSIDPPTSWCDRISQSFGR